MWVTGENYIKGLDLIYEIFKDKGRNPCVEFTSYVNHLIKIYILNIMLQDGYILHQGATLQTAEKMSPLPGA